jgi:hypothetical protein
MGERLPAPPRERKPALAALAVLLILVGALGATMLVLRAGDRIEVVKVTKDIPAGESITKSNVTSVMVSADSGLAYVEWSERAALESYKAKSTIYEGSVLVGQMFAKGVSLPAGKASVGLALKEGQYPASIKAGDLVAAYRTDTGSGNSNSDADSSTGASSSDALIVDRARVNTKSSGDDATISTGNLSITLLVDQSDAAALAQAAAAGDVAVVQVPGN